MTGVLSVEVANPLVLALALLHDLEQTNSPGFVPNCPGREEQAEDGEPPMRWLKARNFSAANLRSANWVLKKRRDQRADVERPEDQRQSASRVEAELGM